MTSNPIVSYGLAVDRERTLRANADTHRAANDVAVANHESSARRSVLASFGQVMIALGERLSGVTVQRTTDVAGSAH